jgi:hypothetical protein
MAKIEIEYTTNVPRRKPIDELDDYQFFIDNNGDLMVHTCEGRFIHVKDGTEYTENECVDNEGDDVTIVKKIKIAYEI